jgi:hypothetical protein
VDGSPILWYPKMANIGLSNRVSTYAKFYRSRKVSRSFGECIGRLTTKGRLAHPFMLHHVNT